MRPDCSTIVETAQLAANCGGLSAEVVDWNFEQHEWEHDNEGHLPELLPDDANVTSAAESDLRLLLASLKRTSKRKSCPEWSVPSEVLALCLNPGYLS